jgi:hypothetical protein
MERRYTYRTSASKKMRHRSAGTDRPYAGVEDVR